MAAGDYRVRKLAGPRTKHWIEQILDDLERNAGKVL
jgi:hypothetical protein